MFSPRDGPRKRCSYCVGNRVYPAPLPRWCSKRACFGSSQARTGKKPDRKRPPPLVPGGGLGARARRRERLPRAADGGLPAPRRGHPGRRHRPGRLQAGRSGSSERDGGGSSKGRRRPPLPFPELYSIGFMRTARNSAVPLSITRICGKFGCRL